MDLRTRFEILAAEAQADREHGLTSPARQAGPVGVTAVRLPGGGTTRLARVMQTNACSLSCGYCPTFAAGKVKRVALTPEEVATVFLDLHRQGLADGLFLTSGVPGRAVRATDRMLAAVELVRRQGFRGYVHLKLLPGADDSQVERAVELASRVSVNLEAPTDVHVHRLAKDKDLRGDLLPKLELAGRLMRQATGGGPPAPFVRAGTTTQFVVGAAGERDREILWLVARLERDRLLHHAHFSAFQPVVGTPLEGACPTPAVRELRLYQAEHLLRDYGFRYEDLAFEPDGNLSLDRDPKLAWALAHPELFPVAIERAPRDLLLRVPGIGPTSLRRLLVERRRTVLRGAEDLRRMGIDVGRAGAFVTLSGRRLAASPPALQLRLFPHGEHLTRAPFSTPVPPCAYR
jgi:predicted DNA-binding helix-hairpin-helix protein